MNKNDILLARIKNAELIHPALDKLQRLVTRPWTIMEICGGQTHAFLKTGLDQLLPREIALVHGPGCPVCVTPLEQIDRALSLAARPGIILCSFGDMLRVPGSREDLFSLRASGAQVQIVYSPLDAVRLAQQNPDAEVVFFAIGFETTAPVNAAAVLQAEALRLSNFSLLVSQVRVPPAMEAILSSPANRIQAFLAAGHVCAIMGTSEYHPIARQYNAPIAVTGFEPLDLVLGLTAAVEMLEAGEARVVNAYRRTAADDGNAAARRMIDKVFIPVDRNWRGIGEIPLSGFGLRPEYSRFDAALRFDLTGIQTRENPICIAGEILQGLKKPPQCSAFGTLCTPTTPIGAPMVSAEGACNAYYRYHGA